MTPTQIVRAAQAAGLDVVGLSDHDSTAGWGEAAQAAADVGVGFLPGVEISTSWQGISIHLLGYLLDPADPGLLAEFERTRSDRDTRARRIVERLNTDTGLTWEEVVAHTPPGATIGRPHIADALVARGVVPNRSAAFEDLLRTGSKYYVSHYAPDPVDAVRLVKAAGGVAVMAHPLAAARGRVVDESVIEAMAGAGLTGLEVDHRDHSPQQRARAAAIADRLGLVRTGSSDFHGTGKPNQLGEHTTSSDALAALVDQARDPGEHSVGLEPWM
ncbi:phosphatase [Branchiibius sp. NY16-3462-2]|nr:phosphatase [Branchiibius sp. NY16-3462-2]